MDVIINAYYCVLGQLNIGLSNEFGLFEKMFNRKGRKGFTQRTQRINVQ